MSAKIIPIQQLQQRYSGSYQFTITHQPEVDYRKYLARQLRGAIITTDEIIPSEATALDISLDDVEGDVVAGLSAWTQHDSLTIDMLWVGEPLRGQGLGHRLLQMAEEIAIKRKCCRARIQITQHVAYFVGMGFHITGTVQALDPKGSAPAYAVYWLEKQL
jgi:GNAT superfamily N-acetyltransferase